MLRISEVTPREAEVTLRFEGRLVGAWVLEAHQICKRLLSETPVLRLDVSDLSYIDRHGARLLVELRALGVSLINSPPFVEEQLKAVLPAI